MEKYSRAICANIPTIAKFMKITYCIPSLDNPGGMERVLTTKANELAEHYGYEVHIVTTDNGKAPFFKLSPLIVRHNLNVTGVNDYRKKLTELLFQLRPQIVDSLCGPELAFLYQIKDGSMKVVEFHFTKYYLTHLVKGILYIRFRYLHLLKAWLLQKKEEYYVNKYDKVVLLTRQDMELWGNKKNMCYIPNPLSFRSECVSTLDNHQMIAVGRYIAQKGFDLLLDAFSLIAKEMPSWTLKIYGEGQDRNILEQKIKTYHLEQQVSLCPVSSQIKQVFLESSLLVFPSRYEGFGLVLTEAMECGLPCISFDCECGPREIIDQGETGFLVKNGNVIEFAQKMKILMTNEVLRKRMGTNGKKSVPRFYLRPVLEQWDQLFIDLCNNKNY